MEKRNSLIMAIDMTDFRNKIKNYNFDELSAEKEKIRKKQNVNYTYMDIINVYYTEKLNISYDPDEKNRIYIRKKVSAIVKLVNDQLNKYAENFSDYWQYINDEFFKTTSSPYFASAKLKGKTVPLADKLNVVGLTAYKRYLLYLNNALSMKKIAPNFKIAVECAIDAEKEDDKKLDREKFFTRYFLPKNIDAIFNNLMKEKVVDERLKEVGQIKKQEDKKEKEL